MIDPFKLKDLRRQALALRLEIRALLCNGPADGADGLERFQALATAFTAAGLTMEALAFASGMKSDPFIIRSASL